MPATTTAPASKLEWNGPVELEMISQLVSTDDPRARGVATVCPLRAIQYNDRHQNAHYRVNFRMGDRMVYSAYVRVSWSYAPGSGWGCSIIDLDGHSLKPFGSWTG